MLNYDIIAAALTQETRKVVITELEKAVRDMEKDILSMQRDDPSRKLLDIEFQAVKHFMTEAKRVEQDYEFMNNA